MGYPHFSVDCRDHHALVRDFGGPRPEIVTLCGSTRFRDEINSINRQLTLQGRLVISMGVFGHTGDPVGEADKIRLDELHKRKIDLADRVVIVNVGGYVGESTRSEIEYATSRGIPVTYRFPVSGEERDHGR